MKLFVIFPARNEGETIAQCIEIAHKSKYKPEILVVDGHSGDNTKAEARDAGAIVISQSKGVYPAKGIAMKDGAREALKRGADCILFLDADIINLTSEWIDLLAEPIIEKACDMSRGYYRRAEYDGAVTLLQSFRYRFIFLVNNDGLALGGTTKRA
ncbi:MAG: glycosyltransferase [Chloroflexota bacterium]